MIKLGKAHQTFTDCFWKLQSVSFAFKVQFSVPWYWIRFGLEKFD